VSIFSRNLPELADDSTYGLVGQGPKGTGHNEDTEPGHETEDSRLCLECLTSLEGKRADSLYCSDRCRKAYTRRQEKIADRKRSYLSDHPEITQEDLDRALEEAQKILGPREDPYEPTELDDDYTTWDAMSRRYTAKAGQGYTPQDRYRDDGSQAEMFRERARASRALNRRPLRERRPSEEYEDARQWMAPTVTQAPSARQGWGRPLPARFYNS
jgi:hypothetical protein